MTFASLFRVATIAALAVAVPAGATLILGTQAAHAEPGGNGKSNGNGNSGGNGNGNGNGGSGGSGPSDAARGNSAAAGAGAGQGDDDVPGNGRGHVASELKHLNAAHALVNGNPQADPDSNVGRIVALRDATESFDAVYADLSAAYTEIVTSGALTQEQADALLAAKTGAEVEAIMGEYGSTPDADAAVIAALEAYAGLVDQSGEAWTTVSTSYDELGVCDLSDAAREEFFGMTGSTDYCS